MERWVFTIGISHATMFRTLKRFLSRFFRKSSSINHEPLNKVSLIVVIIVDLFILFNVFSGLDAISQWHISPSQAYPCLSDWQSYRNQSEAQEARDYNLVQSAIDQSSDAINFQKNYREVEGQHLGTVSPICMTYAELKDKVNTAGNDGIKKEIGTKERNIGTLRQANATIRTQ